MPLDPDCLARLKLRQPPFDPSPSEEFLYSDPLLESLIETASRAMTAPGAIVILAGASGSGRSIQLMRLLGALAARFDLIAFRGRPEIPFDAVDLTIRNHLRASGFDDPNRSLTDLLRDRGRVGEPMALAIDDAHFLGMDSIRQLLRMRSEMLEAKGQGLRLVLVGDLALSRGRLPLTDPADENQVVRLNLRPFNLEQAGAYLRHRLRVAGIDDPDSFLTSGDIAVLQTNSKGLPAALNDNANAWLTRRCRSVGRGKQSVAGKLGGLVSQSAASASPKRETPKSKGAFDTESESPLPPSVPPSVPHSVPPSVPPLAPPSVPNPEDVLDSYSYSSMDSDSGMDSDVDVFEPSAPQLSAFLQQEDRRADSSDFERVLRHVRNHELIQQTLAVEPESASSAVPQPEPSSQSEPYWNRRWFIPAVVAAVLLAIVVPVAFQLFGDRSGDPLLRGSEPSADQAPAAMRPPPQSETANSVQSNGLEREGSQGFDAGSSPAETVASTLSGREEGRLEKTETSVESPNEVAGPSTPFDEGLGWLRRQDPSRLTIQLVAARDLQTARKFVRRHELNGAHYVQTRSFVIAVVGSFPNRSAAKQMLSELPEGARSSGPWIRTVGSVLESRQ